MPSARDNEPPHSTQGPTPERYCARLTQDIDAIAGVDAGPLTRFGVAVSGGPDSMALLALMARAYPDRVEAITVDHQLRAEAADEAAMVARWCAGQGIAHSTFTPDAPITGNTQSQARAARYALIERWRVERGIDWVATAHHADDQAETLIMRLNRASGVAGLAGVRARNGAVIRPVLGWRRAELAQVVALLALPHVNDPSNSDTRYDRAALRQKLAGCDWIDPAALARSAQAMADAEQAIGWMVADLVHRHIHEDANGAIILDRTDVPREILRRMILHMVERAGGQPKKMRGEAIDQALIQLYMGKTVSVGAWVIEGGAVWRLKPAPPRRH